MKQELLKNKYGIENEEIAKVVELYINKEVETANSFGENVNEEKIILKLGMLYSFEWKDRLVFHEECLDCLTPIHETISTCLTCKYCRGAGSDFEDKSEKYKDNIKYTNLLDVLSDTRAITRITFGMDKDTKPNDFCYWDYDYFGVGQWVEDDDHLRKRIVARLEEI